jgi:hypothetical protein
MKWVLLVYLISGNNANLTTTLKGYKTQNECLLASKNITITPGPNTLAFSCKKIK